MTGSKLKLPSKKPQLQIALGLLEATKLPAQPNINSRQKLIKQLFKYKLIDKDTATYFSE